MILSSDTYSTLSIVRPPFVRETDMRGQENKGKAPVGMGEGRPDLPLSAYRNNSLTER